MSHSHRLIISKIRLKMKNVTVNAGVLYNRESKMENIINFIGIDGYYLNRARE